MTIQIIQNSKGSHFTEVRLDKGLGANNSFSNRAVEEVEGSSFRVAAEDSSFLVDLASEWEAGSEYVDWSLGRSDRAGAVCPFGRIIVVFVPSVAFKGHGAGLLFHDARSCSPTIAACSPYLNSPNTSTTLFPSPSPKPGSSRSRSCPWTC